ncbi:MAG: peptidylprolyl isomerase, partial [Oscillospiraceae bacterium]|nr:peptidylprolyl isomerase [Oscillospiraceae bacterium]
PAAPAAAPEIDLEALYASHAPDEVVAVLDGKDVTWAEYFYQLQSQIHQTESYLSTMAAYYGLELGWNDVAEGEEETYADITVANAEQMLLPLAAVEGFAEENGIRLTPASEAAIADQLTADMTTALGEGAEEADFDAYLEGIYMPRSVYDRINRANYLYQDGYTQLYGENGAKVSDEQAQAYLDESGYLAANHILLMTIDPETGEELSEADIQNKKAVADTLAGELKAIEDHDKLLARFGELKEEYCEDTGKVTNPDGYVFTPGTMVAEFEESCQALGEYEVSDPVKTSYGYHVILRKPLDIDSTLRESTDGTPLTARSLAANMEYGQRVQDYLNGMELHYAEGFALPKLTDYLK